MREKKPDVRSQYEALIADPTTLTPEELETELADVQPEPSAVRSRVAEMARALAAELRKGGIPAPPVLRDVAEAMSETNALPKDEKLARSRAAKRIADLEIRRPIPRDYSLVEAARKGPGELAPEDRALLDEAAEDLRREIDTENDETK